MATHVNPKDIEDIMNIISGAIGGAGNNRSNSPLGAGNSRDPSIGDPNYEPGFGAVSANPDGTVGAGNITADPRTQTGTGMDPFTGFAAQQGYTPSQATAAFENPWYILPDVFEGIQSNSPGYQALRDFGADPLVMYNIMSGAAPGMTENNATNEFINFMNQLYQNLGTRGGQGFSGKELLQNIANAAGQTKNVEGQDVPTTALGNILSMGDQSTQVRTLFNLLRDISNVSMNPLAASAYQGAVARAGDVYGNAMMKSDAGNTTGPTQYLQERMPWLFGR